MLHCEMVVTVEAGAVTVTVWVGLFGAAAAKIARVENAIALENIILSRVRIGCWVWG